FGNLRPGTYTVTETQPASYLDGLEAKNNVVLPASAGGRKAMDEITINPGGEAINKLIGELRPGSLSGFVYVDASNNGLKESTETAIAGVTLTLTGSDDLGAIVSRNTTTSSTGTYSFGNLRPGTYTVTESQPAGYLDGLDARNNTVLPGS